MAQTAGAYDLRGSLGVTNGMLQGTKVLTLDGDIPVDFLELGDRVLTRSGARILKTIEISLVRNARMVRVGASTLGQENPEDDILVPATQMVLVRDWRAMAFGGTKQALIMAARLCDGEFIRGETVELARIYSLGFEDEAVIYAGGMELACDAAPVSV